MKIQQFLNLVSKPGRTNYMVVCSNELGLSLLLQGALSVIAVPEDIEFHDAENITKEKARQIEAASRLASRGGSELNHFFIYNLHNLPTSSTGPILKAVEESKYSRFIFQAQTIPRKIYTLMSRSSVVRLPFLSKAIVLGNMKAMNYDARTADQLNLYDGTLAGTIKALTGKDAIIEIHREMKRGLRGLLVMYNPEILNSLVFESATYNFMFDEEKELLRRAKKMDKRRYASRQKLMIYRAMQRIDKLAQDGM